LREEESPILPGEGREEEGLGSLSGLFLYHLELGGWETKCHHLAPLTCELREEPFSQEDKKSQTAPNLACLSMCHAYTWLVFEICLTIYCPG
jgi:hypothetical protein